MKKRPRKGMPTILKVLDIEYRIEYWTEPTEVAEFLRVSEAVGYICVGLAIIRIWDNGQPRSTLWNYLRHEAIHAIWFAGSMPNLRSRKSANRHENLIDHLTTGINLVARDNPGFWDREN